MSSGSLAFARDNIARQCQFSIVAGFLKSEYNRDMTKRKIIIKIFHSKRRIPRELREAVFKRKAGRIMPKKNKENMKEWLAELES